MKRLACLIVHYGEARVTRDCLASLLAADDPPGLLVVCNSSGQEAQTLAQALRQDHPGKVVLSGPQEPLQGQEDVRVLATGSNRGFAAACNLGIKALESWPGLEWIWILNNDTLVAPQAPERLRDCLEQHPRAVVGTAVVRHDDPQRLELALGCRFRPATSTITPVLPGGLLAETAGRPGPEVDYVYGASFALPLRLAQEIGGLNEEFFLFYEELDFCLRARRAGYALRWCPGAVVRHGTGRKPSGQKENRESRAFRHFHETLSTFLFLWRHHPWALATALPIRTMAKLILLPLRGEAWLLASYFSGIRAFLGRVAGKKGGYAP